MFHSESSHQLDGLEVCWERNGMERLCSSSPLRVFSLSTEKCRVGRKSLVAIRQPAAQRMTVISLLDKNWISVHIKYT